jgi:hypothetical protein
MRGSPISLPFPLKNLQEEVKNGFFRRFSEAKSRDVGDYGGEKFSTGIDSKRVTNNLQGFEGNLHSLLEGVGYKPGGGS